MGTHKTDAELCGECHALEPEWIRGREKAEQVMALYGQALEWHTQWMHTHAQ